MNVKKKQVTQEFSEYYTNYCVYNENKHGYFITMTKKPPKKIESEAMILFSSFGGAEIKKFKYEFSYDARSNMDNAIQYGYFPNIYDNYCFLPPNIENVLFDFMILPSSGNIFYPYYGYGYNHVKKDKWRSGIDNSLVCENINMPKYDGILFRPPLFGIKKAFSMFDDIINLLNQDARIACVIDKTWLTYNMDKLIDNNFYDISKVSLPYHLWTPPQEIKIHTFLLRMRKK